MKINSTDDDHYDENLKSNHSNKSSSNQEQKLSRCVWCEKLGNESLMLQCDNDNGKILCNEVCFNQYRRAAFKRNKIKKLLKTRQTVRFKPKKSTSSKPTLNQSKHSDQQRNIPSYSRLTRINADISRRLSPSLLPSSLPMNYTFPPFLYHPSTSMNLNYYQYPIRHSLPLRIASPSNIIPIVTKELLSNYTCILPSFIQLPMPVPVCFPVQFPYEKCSTNFINETCQPGMKNFIDPFPKSQQQIEQIPI